MKETPMADHTTSHAAAVDFDRRDPKSGLIAIVTGVILGVLIAFIVGIWVLYNVWYDRVDQEQYSGVASQELEQLHQREDAELYRYGWLDKEKGVVRVPIDRAMDLVAADAAASRDGYNTKTYPVKLEPPGGAAATPLNTATPEAPKASKE
jgi:hypothetical protein